MKLLAGIASGGLALISTAVCEAASATMVGATLIRTSGRWASTSAAKASVVVMAASAASARAFPLMMAAAAFLPVGAASCPSSEIVIAPHSRAATSLFALRLAPLQELLEQPLLLGGTVGRSARGLLAHQLVIDDDVSRLRGRHLLELLLGNPKPSPARHLGRQVDALPLRVVGRLVEFLETVEVEIDEARDAAEPVAVTGPVVDGQHRLHAEGLHFLARLDVARIVLGREDGGDVKVLELVEGDSQELEAAIVLVLGEQVV